MGYIEDGRCGYRQVSHLGDVTITWECTRPKHGKRTVKDAQGRVVAEVADHWYRRVKEDDDEGSVGRRT